MFWFGRDIVNHQIINIIWLYFSISFAFQDMSNVSFDEHDKGDEDMSDEEDEALQLSSSERKLSKILDPEKCRNTDVRKDSSCAENVYDDDTSETDSDLNEESDRNLKDRTKSSQTEIGSHPKKAKYRKIESEARSTEVNQLKMEDVDSDSESSDSDGQSSEEEESVDMESTDEDEKDKEDEENEDSDGDSEKLAENDSEETGKYL
jgi:hypothetical protein